MRTWIVTVGLMAAVTVSLAAATALRASPLRQDEQCTVTGDKVVSPAKVRLGETVQVRLTLNAECPPSRYHRADIVLVVDRSRSMENYGKLTAAKNAAKVFAGTVDLQNDRVAVVAFHAASEVAIGFSDDLAAIDAAIDAIGIESGTDVSLAIQTAQDLLVQGARADALPVMILITDGSPNRPPSDPRGEAINQADAAKLAGTHIFTVGLGPDADTALLRDLASADTDFYYAPSNDELEEIYRTIATLVGNYVLLDVIVDDLLTPDVTLVAGTDLPTATITDQEMQWTVGLMPPDGVTWVYQVKPGRAGVYPTNVWALATYTDADRERREFEFPKPLITVIDPNAETPCQGPNAWTVMIQAFPDSVGISGSSYPGCNNQLDSGDWFLGAAYHLPPLEFQLTSALDGELLYRGQGVSGPGRVDQRLYMRVCQPPPYRLQLLSTDLNGYQSCPNSPVERIITSRDFRPAGLNRTEERFGFVR